MKELISENWITIGFLLLFAFAIFIEPRLPKKQSNHKQFKMN